MKILFYTQGQWAFGSIHHGISKYAHEKGHIFDTYDWFKPVSPTEFSYLVDFYDYIVTSAAAPEIQHLTKVLKVPYEKIIAIAHGDWDLNLLSQSNMIEELSKIAGFAVVSEALYCSAIAVHVACRKPKILPLGICYNMFFADPSERLNVAGYSGSFDRVGASGINIKRGYLALRAAEDVGLPFRKFTSVAYQAMPQAYKSIDALIVPSIQEGAGLPSMEAAAAGRLVISTGVGHFPEHASLGCGIVAPVDERKFLEFVTKTLRYYVDNPAAYRERCFSIREAAKVLDWSYRVDEWIEFFEDPTRSS